MNTTIQNSSEQTNLKKLEKKKHRAEYVKEYQKRDYVLEYKRN
jgi:hypothetical protein